MHSLKTAVGLAALIALGAPVCAETINCTPISTVPYVINASGLYCLTADVNTAQVQGTAITINANNVVLDLNGHKIGGLSAGPGSAARGIASTGKVNITIKNGTVRGFYYGIELSDAGDSLPAQGHVVEDIRADQNLKGGIRIDGENSTIRRCQVIATGVNMVSANNTFPTGILVTGPGNRVIDNDVMTVVKQGLGTAYGIHVGPESSALVVNNRISEADVGVFFSSGTSKFRDNLTVDVATPYDGGTNVGNNH